MALTPLSQSCPHLATPQEQARDPGYLACYAQPGEPCRWARRHDGVAVPEFHAERLEMAVAPAPPANSPKAEPFENWVLESGLV